MIAITHTVDKFIFTEGDHEFATLKSNISDIKLKPDRNKILIEVMRARGPKFIELKFDNVSSPSCANVTALYNLLLDYWNVMSGAYQTFTATSGQTVFTVTEFSLNDNYKVFVNGSLVTSGFTRVGDVVTFSSGHAAGTEVVIMN